MEHQEFTRTCLKCIPGLNRVLKCDVTKNKFVKLWDLAPFSNRASFKRFLAKNYLLIVISSQNIKDESLILPHINLSTFELVPNWRKWHKFWRVCMGCYQTLMPYFSVGNCNSELIFGMRASFRILYKNMTSYPRISKKYFCDVITLGLYWNLETFAF